MIDGSRECCTTSPPPNKFLTAAVLMAVRGHNALTATEKSANSPAIPSTHMDIPENNHYGACWSEANTKRTEFSHGVRAMRSEPFCFHVQWRRDVEHVCMSALLEIWQALLSDHKRAPRIHAVHQIKAFHRSGGGVGKRYGRSIVD